VSSLRTRFAPSPTGPLHLGHAYAALLAQDLARASGGEFLLRIEDIDTVRARPEWEAQIFEDLRWLGLDWPKPVMRQSDRLPAYRAALDDLWARGLLYPCHCTRRDIAEALSAPQEGVPIHGPDGPVYPGTCRPTPDWQPDGPCPRDVPLRLHMARALAVLGPGPVRFAETGPGREHDCTNCTNANMLTQVGDVVLARRDMGSSYHLSVVVDDAEQQIGLVTRGADLFEATFIHVVLQGLMGLPSPTYLHHRLIRDATGKRLAKRHDAMSIAQFRTEGQTPDTLRELVGLSPSAP
jgi:glutamyl-Q tRNA(Asp) synthetase